MSAMCAEVAKYIISAARKIRTRRGGTVVRRGEYWGILLTMVVQCRFERVVLLFLVFGEPGFIVRVQNRGERRQLQCCGVPGLHSGQKVPILAS